MEWSDEGIVLSVRTHGEAGAIVEALTHGHGRHLGLIRGGNSRRARPVLQPGNSVYLTWRARLSEHLGNYTAELVRARAGALLDSRDALTGLNAFTGVASALLPERQVHGAVFKAGGILLDAMMEGTFLHWGPLYVRWEAGLLEELGFGLDLSECAATGSREDLAFVSPRSGRAVSNEAAGPYRERLLPLPQFLIASNTGSVSERDVKEGLRLTGHFLKQRVLDPHNQKMPDARSRLDALAERESK